MDEMKPLTESERAQAKGQFALAIERHRRRCNARDTAIDEARVRNALHREGIVFVDADE